MSRLCGLRGAVDHKGVCEPLSAVVTDYLSALYCDTLLRALGRSDRRTAIGVLDERGDEPGAACVTMTEGTPPPARTFATPTNAEVSHWRFPLTPESALSVKSHTP